MKRITNITCSCIIFGMTANVFADCDGKHATFDSVTSTLTLPAIQIPLLHPITGMPTGQQAIFKGEMLLLNGVDDFVIKENSFEYLSIATSVDACAAQYTYVDFITPFANGGVLTIPYVDVETVIILPPHQPIPGAVVTFQAKLRQLSIDQTIFHVSSLTEITSTALNDPCDQNTTEGQTKLATQLLEPFLLFDAVDDMVIVDYMIFGTWPTPLSTSITPPSGNFTQELVSLPKYIEATMRTTIQNSEMCPQIAGKTIRFIWSDTSNNWTCTVTGVPNGVPKEFLSSCK